MGKKLKKSFNGKFFVKFLQKNAPANQKSTYLVDYQYFENSFESKSFPDSFDKDASIKYAQNLLEADYLSLIEIKSIKNNLSN